MRHKIDRSVPMAKSSLAMLKKIYDIHDRIMGRASWACQETCSACCTRNVTMTTLEGRYILETISPEKGVEILNQVRASQSEKRYQPKLTANGFADACLMDRDIPEEENDPSWGPCPLLQDSRCPIYDQRPMGCRAMVSEVRCDGKEGALMADRFVTMGQLFLQYVEHMDQNGHFGNMSDILLLLETGTDRTRPGEALSPVLKNKPASFLLIPPEHQAEMRDLVEEIEKSG